MDKKNSALNSERLTEILGYLYYQMDGESDRGAVIVSVSLIDELLTNSLKGKLAPSLEKSDELFDASFSPFNSFSTKIDLAYRIGLIGPNVRKSLHLLRKIRNDFAHLTDVKGFNDSRTQDRIRELVKLNGPLIELIFEIVKKTEQSEGNRVNVNNIKDLIRIMGWRGILQIIFASIGASMADGVDELVPITVRNNLSEK
jgi:hypothetical protein